MGTGWTPIIPALFSILHPARIICTDVERLIDASTIEHARRFVSEQGKRVSEALCLPASEIASTLAGFHFDYRCPFDPRSVPDGSVDIIYSRAVLEHIDPGTLSILLQHSRRMLRAGGLICHSIDNSDHFEHKDKSLSRLNFLRYGPSAWRVMCLNRQNYQNRLRHADYESLLASAGFHLLASIGEPDEAALRDLDTLNLASPFAGRLMADLAILTSMFLAKRP